MFEIKTKILGGVFLKAVVDKETCIACGLCPTICPDVFEMQDDGKAGTISHDDSNVPEEEENAAKEAEESCPVNAIEVS